MPRGQLDLARSEGAAVQQRPAHDLIVGIETKITLVGLDQDASHPVSLRRRHVMVLGRRVSCSAAHHIPAFADHITGIRRLRIRLVSPRLEFVGHGEPVQEAADEDE